MVSHRRDVGDTRVDRDLDSHADHGYSDTTVCPSCNPLVYARMTAKHRATHPVLLGAPT